MTVYVSDQQTSSGVVDQLVWRCIDRYGGCTEDTSFGALLRRLRQGAALSQQELAERIGTTQSAIARLESGSAQPKLTTLSKLAEALGENLHIHIIGRIDGDTHDLPG